MPVRASGWLQVMRQACPETAGAVGAAYVDVESGLKLQDAKLADTDVCIFARCKNEGVSSGMRPLGPPLWHRSPWPLAQISQVVKPHSGGSLRRGHNRGREIEGN